MSPATPEASGTSKKSGGESDSLLEMMGLPRPAKKKDSSPEKALSPEEVKFKKCRNEDFEKEANLKIGKVKEEANKVITEIKKDIKGAQTAYYMASQNLMFRHNDIKAGFQVDPKVLKQAEADRDACFQEVQRNKRRLDQVATWRHQQIREIWSLRDQAKDRSFKAYRKLIHYDVKTINPGQFTGEL